MYVKLLVYNSCIENFRVYRVKNVLATEIVNIHDILINLINVKFNNINILIINLNNKINEIISKQDF